MSLIPPLAPAAPVGAPVGAPAAAPVVPPQAPAVDPNRPAWLPQEFQTPEDLAKAYTETISRPQPRIDAQKLNDKFLANGRKFLPEDIKELEQFGLSEEHVRVFETGLTAQAEAYTKGVYDAAGGEAGYKAAATWAGRALAAPEQTAYDAEVNSGDLNRARIAVSGLVARYRLAAGADPTARLGGAAGVAGPQPFRSTAEMKAAIMNTKYTTDSAYRADTDARIIAMQ